MKKNIVFVALGLIVSAHATAQETYLNAAIATEGLNGTARYVGMGGAMDALGADLSTISSNPAGIGLFRSSQAKLSFGLVSQEDAVDFAGTDKTRMSFDQVGFVYSMRTGKQSFVNIALNYHKSTNFGQILSAASALNEASQNKQSFIKISNGLFNWSVDKSDIVSGKDGSGVYSSNLFNAVDYEYYNALTTEPGYLYTTYYYDAIGYTFNRAHSGYIGNYELNISGNCNDQLYLGVTVGINDVHYNAYSQYTEQLIGYDDASIGSVTMTDDRTITGTGFSIKVGAIVRPMAESPFRIGVSVASPTFYDLTSTYSTRLDNNTSVGRFNSAHKTDSYDFRLNTPWKFGLSAGSTFGNNIALGAAFEYADYGNLDTRIKNGGYRDWDGSYYSSSSSDGEMNAATKQTLKGVCTVKLGAEFRPDPSIAVRLGYNYVSPMYKTSAEKGVLVNSVSNAYTSTTDYTNWKATNRVTCGLGYTADKFTIDLAYQYSMQNGTFHPFVDSSAEDVVNKADGVSVKNNQHQVLMTLGYAF